MFFRGDMDELRRIFKKMNVQVNSFLSGDCSCASVKRMFKSDLTISLSSKIGQKALQMIKRNGGPNTCQFNVAPIGFEYTKRFLIRVGELLNLDPDLVGKVIDEEELNARKKMLRGFDFSKVMFTSARAAIIGEPSRTIALTNFVVNELGIKPLMIAFTSKVSDAELEELDKILKLRSNKAKVLIEQDNYLIRKTMLETKPNLVFGRSIDRIKELDKTAHITWQFPSTDRLVIYDRPYLGFNGVVSIVDDIVNGFSRIWY
jgi:nitrogenase molybdenum-iron protein beta chain